MFGLRGRMVTIRPEKPDDIATVRTVNKTAFGQLTEAEIVDSLRTACPDAVSLVSVENITIVGHIFFSPVVVSGEKKAIKGMGLAPMAVLPHRQRQGIGSLLVKAGIDVIRERNCPFIIVLGHPEYYPRFGFVPASQRGLTCHWQGVPDDAFMVLILDESNMAGVSGIVRYRDEFDRSM